MEQWREMRRKSDGLEVDGVGGDKGRKKETTSRQRHCLQSPGQMSQRRSRRGNYAGIKGKAAGVASQNRGPRKRQDNEGRRERSRLKANRGGDVTVCRVVCVRFRLCGCSLFPRRAAAAVQWRWAKARECSSPKTAAAAAARPRAAERTSRSRS